MRLLRFDATSDRLVLTDFRGKPIPPYAILSHRWSDSETLIEDISNRTYKKKEEGYRKLMFCAQQTAKDGLQYFWIDTCCIERWDHDERSRAINSMFQWYQNAARCYVFLSDVSLSPVAETAPRSDWHASFCASAWFTRGWTLQELIAPMTVDFFSCEGSHLGDKASLEQLLHHRTGIPIAALRNSPLDQFSTSERRRWAENRTTTEEEDIVYCLLGVLGTSMPITYGEGQESARRRLQAELEATSNAPSIIPFSRNESFVGREQQLASLEAQLFTNEQTTTVLAIVGPGGIGKSQLALEVAYRIRLNNEDCSVFWIDASDLDSLYRSYASVALKLGFPTCDDDRADRKQVIQRCVSELSMRQCLLIFDNVGDTSLPPNSSSSTTGAAPLTDFLPQSKLCSVIFTTTESNVAEALAPRNVIAQLELTPDMALRMLQNRLTRPLLNAEQQQAMDLLRAISHLPLAIVQAAAQIEASGMTVQQYQAQLAEYKEAALEHSNDPSEGKLRESHLTNAIVTTLSLSVDQVRRSNAVAADYLFFAACVHRKDISLDLLEASSPQARVDAIKILDQYSLITRRPADSSLDLHRLVHLALRKRLQAEGRLQEWMQRTITQLLRLFPNHDHSNRSKWRRLLPHAQDVLSHTPRDNGEERLDLAWKCAMALYSDGQYKGAEKLLVEVMETRKRVLGEEHPDTLTSMNNLAATYSFQGRWKEAEVLQVHIMQTRKRVLGDEHPDTMTSMNNLAVTYRDQGRWTEAEALHMQDMQLRKRVLGEEHPDTLTSLHNLAATYSKQGRWKEAEELQVQELQAIQKVLGDEHPDALSSMAFIASTYSSQGRWKEAEELQTREMQIRRRVLGENHPSTLSSMNNLALTYWRQGRWTEAEELQVQEIKASKKVLSDEHPNILTSMNNLALTCWSQDRFTEAEELQLSVLHTRERLLGTKHPDTLTSMYTLAFTLQSQDRHDEAVELMDSCCKLREESLGKQHSDTQSALGVLASWRSRYGNNIS